MLKEIVTRNRSYRRFFEDQAISIDELKDLVELARLCPSASNAQPLKYILSAEKEKNNRIFPCLRWAAALKDWPGPVEGERPSAYIIIVSDSAISANVKWDHGICAQTIMLGAVEKGYGGCILASVDKSGLRESLIIPRDYEIELVLALGKPKEKVVIDPVAGDGNTHYWRGPDRVHHVPKRNLNDLILDL